MTKPQKIIVLAASVLIIAVIIFPPIYAYKQDREWEYSYSGWMFIVKIVNDSSAMRPKIQMDILTIEIFGILVLAGAALLITKKK